MCETFVRQSRCLCVIGPRTGNKSPWAVRKNSRDFLLCPLQIPAHLARIAHPLLEALARPREAGLRLLLQLNELAVLGVELSRSVDIVAR